MAYIYSGLRNSILFQALVLRGDIYENITVVPGLALQPVRRSSFVRGVVSVQRAGKQAAISASVRATRIFTDFPVLPNEAVEKQLKNILTTKWVGGETLPDTTIVDAGAFCEASFLPYVIEIFSFGFFYSINATLTGARRCCARPG